MNGDFKGFFYCLDLSFYKKCNGAKQVTFINVETVVELSRNIKKLSRKKVVVWIQFGQGLDTRPVRSLIRINDLRTHVYCQYGPVSVGFVSTV